MGCCASKQGRVVSSTGHQDASSADEFEYVPVGSPKAPANNASNSNGNGNSKSKSSGWSGPASEGELESLCLRRLDAVEAGDVARVGELDASIADRFEMYTAFALVQINSPTASPSASASASAAAAAAAAAETGAGAGATETAVHELALILGARDIISSAAGAHGGSVVKVEHVHMFVAFPHPAAAVSFAVRALDAMARHNAGLSRGGDAVSLSIGVDAGTCLLLPTDIYGNAVNVSSKLAEELGSPGSLLVSAHVRDVVVPALLQDSMLAPCSARVSKINLSYYAVAWKPAIAKIGRVDGGPASAPAPDLGATGSSLAGTRPRADMSEIRALCADYLDATDPESRAELAADVHELYEDVGVVFVSDMSGFTYLSQKHGILYFLSLIYKMRSVLRPLFSKYGGDIIRTQGDDYKAFFASPESAIACALEAQAAVRPFADISVCIGLAAGRILRVPEEANVFGPAADAATHLGEELASPTQVLVDYGLWSAIGGTHDPPDSLRKHPISVSLVNKDHVILTHQA